MPNWCSNTIVVGGEAADISEFNTWLGDGKNLLFKIKPIPQKLVDTVAGFHGDPEKQAELEKQEQSNLEQFGYRNWYDWNIGNWGTKWDIDAEIDDSNNTDDQVIFSFESAWSPPQKAIAILAEKFNKLSFRHSYLEEGVGFVGYDEYDTGGLTNSEYNEDSQSDEWKQLAADEFGWEPWPDDEDEMEQNEEGKVTETPKPAEKPAKKKAKKTSVKKPTKKVAKKKAKKKK